MPYIYEASFDITPDEMDELEVGSSLSRTLGYLRALLPNEHGFVTSQALYSVDDPKRTTVVFRSEWGSWEALKAHESSAVLETKVLQEFGEDIVGGKLATRVYATAGPKPY